MERVYEVSWVNSINIKCVYAGTEAEAKRVYARKLSQQRKGQLVIKDLKMESTDRYI